MARENDGSPQSCRTSGARISVREPQWRGRLARSFPFYYGWVVFAVCASVSYSSRPVMAVATLSVFLVPMTEEFGWSRGMFAGAVSLGGILAVAISPIAGWWIDRYGSAVVVSLGGLVTGVCAALLSIVAQPWAFYALYVPGRMAFASPLELGTSTALSNWFIRRRALILGLLNVSQGSGLALMPLVAQLIIAAWSWRVAWLSLGIYTISIAVIPALLLLARRPEDMGLEADPVQDRNSGRETESSSGELRSEGLSASTERNYTLQEARHTRAFWLLAGFSAVGFMVQAGVSLHQVGHYIDQGLSGPAAAVPVSVFALSQVPGGLMWSGLARRVPIRYLLALSGCCVGAGALGTSASTSLWGGIPSAVALGVGVGGLLVLLRLVWADYYGRQYLGRIRGVTLPAQIAGQAMGPIFAGFLYDAIGSYQVPFIAFGIGVSVAALVVLWATPPTRPARAEEA